MKTLSVIGAFLVAVAFVWTSFTPQTAQAWAAELTGAGLDCYDSCSSTSYPSCNQVYSFCGGGTLGRCKGWPGPGDCESYGKPCTGPGICTNVNDRYCDGYEG